jgi:hypothetical protein
LISRDSAEREYRVVIAVDGSVDFDGTAHLRAPPAAE